MLGPGNENGGGSNGSKRGAPGAQHAFDVQRLPAIRRLPFVSNPASPNTLAALRAGFLASQGLFHDARLILIAALKKHPDEPALHQLLGNLYTKVGLSLQAAEEYEEAKFLLTPASAPTGR